MPTTDTLRSGRKHSDEEVEALHPNRRPIPLRPFDYSHPAPRQGAGLTRRSEYGDRWCAFCQTPMDRSSRAGSCDPCKDRRNEIRDRLRNGAPPATASQPEARQQNLHDIQNMLDAIERLSQVVGTASAQRYRNGGMKPDDVEDMLFACKDVMVAADPLRRRLRSAGN